VSKEQNGEGGIMTDLMIGTPGYLFGWATQRVWDAGACGTHGGRNMLTVFWWGKL